MTKKEIYDVLCDWGGCVTCGKIANINGNNECYVDFNIDDLIDEESELYIMDDMYHLEDCHKVEIDEINIDEWTQGMPFDCGSTKCELYRGNLYMAVFTNEKNRYSFLFWK